MQSWGEAQVLPLPFACPLLLVCISPRKYSVHRHEVAQLKTIGKSWITHDVPRYQHTLASYRQGFLSSPHLRWDASGIHECCLDHLQAGSHSLQSDSVVMDVEAYPPWTYHQTGCCWGYQHKRNLLFTVRPTLGANLHSPTLPLDTPALLLASMITFEEILIADVVPWQWARK